MKKRIIALIVAVVLCLPCLLILNENLNWWNALGISWFGFIAFGGMKYLVPNWMWSELQDFCRERDDD